MRKKIDNSQNIIGLTVLTGKEITPAQNKALEKRGYAIQHIEDPFQPLSFSVIDKEDGTAPILIITTPLGANLKEGNADFASAFAKIQKQLHVDDLNHYHIIAPLVGEGVTEGHITTLYRPPGVHARYTIFDSKIGDSEAFLTSPNTTVVVRRFSFGKALRGLARAFFNGRFTENNVDVSSSETVPDALKKIDYASLGIQSFFDGVSCGFHHLSTSMSIISLVHEGEAINQQNLLDKIAEKDPLQEATSFLNEAGIKVKTSYNDFIKKAWEDTFLPNMSRDQRKKTSFIEYFLGWPAKNGAWEKVAYVVLLGWIFTPGKNIIKLSTEFLLKAVSESFNFLKHALFKLSPTSVAGQLLRSAALFITYGLHGIAEGARLLVRTVTSPLVSMEDAWNIHPALGVLSIVCSASAYVALSILAAPALLAVGAKAGIIASLNAVSSVTVLSKIAYPLVWLLGNLGVGVTPALAGAAALSTLGVAATLVNGTREGLSVPITSNTSQRVEQSLPPPVSSDNTIDAEDDWLDIEPESPRRQSESPAPKSVSPTSMSNYLLTKNPDKKFPNRELELDPPNSDLGEDTFSI